MAKFIKIVNGKQTNNFEVIRISAISKIIATRSDLYNPPYSELCSIHLTSDKDIINVKIELDDLMDFLAKSEDSQNYLAELLVSELSI